MNTHEQRQGIGRQRLQAGLTAFPTARTIRLEVEKIITPPTPAQGRRREP